ncbi:Cytoskeletal signaling protein slm1 [Cladophialophora carrionii]|uniref:Cytoskeletal signaling protein slm1 n=1 Tax=Cladophialophora carrionii TaxID=86049 RepID=A0A1C1CCP0_9EURO|nr:Cytoskeletal signaling protein slm1 [Cladophialophora carrionii]
MATPALPTRVKTANDSDDDVVNEGDPSSTAGLLIERLQAWKHMCGYLENYISAVAKEQAGWAREHEKTVLKTLANPLREAHHFDSALGGVTGLFENLRANTQAQISLHTETSKNLTGSVLPILERLHAEIKNKNKEITNGAGKGSKAVDAARGNSQKHIELLGQQAAHFDSTGGKVSAHHDPYVLRRGVLHRLNKQMLEENNNRQDLIAVQNSFSQFEAHVIQTVQTALNSYNQFMSGQADRQKAMFGDVAATTSNIPLDFEWSGFLKRNQHVLVNPNAPMRTMNDVSFPNEKHRSTKPLVEGTLERKSRGMGALKGYSSGYYAVTPAGYLHEYKDNENFHKEPTPEHSLYLPDCIIGAVDGPKFTIKGKDSSGSKFGQKMAITSDFQFKAHTNSDAQQWHSVIASFANSGGSLPTSPVESRNITPIATRMEEPQTQGVTSAGPTPTSAKTPTSVQPTSATSATAPTSAGEAPHAGPSPNALEGGKLGEK